MIHFLMTIGDIPSMYFHAELFLRSLIFNSKIDFAITIIVTTSKDPYNWNVVEDDRITQYVKHNHPIISKYAEVLASPACYTTHPNIRWKIAPRAKVCAFVDADLLICRSLVPFYNSVNNKMVNGLVAFDCPVNTQQWDELFLKIGIPEYEKKLTIWSRKECPSTYFNYGNLVVPADMVRTIGDALESNIHILNSIMPNYFAGQMALTATIEMLKIPTAELQLRYNFPDLYDVHINEKEFSEITISHYMHRKSIITNFESVTSMQSDPFGQLIKDCFNNTYSMKMI